jgi:hypothetical protein
MQANDNNKWSPTFIGIGAERSATTWCFRCLDEHPQICMGHPKEVNYFNLNYELGETWYRRHFTHRPEANVIGEISPLYMVDPLVCERIARDYPNVKILVILRNPYERALSHLLLILRMERGLVDVDDVALVKNHAAHQDKYLKNSSYFQRLRPYFNAFPREKIIIHYYEDLKKDYKAFLQSLCASLEVDQNFMPESAGNIINRTSNYQWPVLFWSLRKLVQGVRALPGTVSLMEKFKQRSNFRFGRWVVKFFEFKTAVVTKPKLDFTEIFGKEGVATISADMELLAKELHLKVPESWHCPNG